MDNAIQKAAYVALASLGLALLWNYLFFDVGIGISVFVFATVLLAAVFGFAKYQQVPLQKTWWLVLLIVFFALMPAVRASGFLTFLNVCATFALLMLLAHALVGTPTFLMRLRDYAALVVVVPFRMLGKGLATTALLGQVHSKVKNRDTWLRALKGGLMALPILLIFGLLFSQADLAFSKFLSGFIHISISERMLGHVIFTSFAFAAGLSFLSYIFFTQKEDAPTAASKPDSAPEGRALETAVFLGLIALLFLVFIAFQITYLFGGEANIAGAGFTYAEYARQGFWELLMVALLSLLVLLAAEHHAGAETKRDQRFLAPALVLTGEVIVVIISAFKRFSLYIDAYSLTELRFYVAGFIVLLLVLFLLLAIKFIKAKPEQFFTFGALLSAVAFLIVVNLINPDAFIARSNIARFVRTGSVDVYYVRSLSADATAQKLELYSKLQGENKADLADHLQFQKERLLENSHWQNANWSRAQARKLLQDLKY